MWEAPVGWDPDDAAALAADVKVIPARDPLAHGLVDAPVAYYRMPGPAGHKSRYEDPAMVDDMLDAVAAAPGSLPLLQFAAARLWTERDRDRRLITRASYTAMGGSAGTLAGHADTVLGGIRNQLTVYASNTLIQCNINPNDACQAYTPDPQAFDGEYITEKIETTAGWTHPAPDEDWVTGYPAELQDFCEAVASDREPDSGPLLARDTSRYVDLINRPPPEPKPIAPIRPAIAQILMRWTS